MITPRTHGAWDWWWHCCYVLTAPGSHSWDQRQNQTCVPTVITSTRMENISYTWLSPSKNKVLGPHLQHSSSRTTDLQRDSPTFSGVILGGFGDCLDSKFDLAALKCISAPYLIHGGVKCCMLFPHFPLLHFILSNTLRFSCSYVIQKCSNWLTSSCPGCYNLLSFAAVQHST